MRYCYCGTYTSTHSLDECGTPPESLTADQGNNIRTFQNKAGGYMPNDMRQLTDYKLTPELITLIDTSAYLDRPSTDKECIALEQQGLIEWWEPITRGDGTHVRAHWHGMGPITHVEHLIDTRHGRDPRPWSLCTACSTSAGAGE